MTDLPSGTFDLILADPPWRFTSNSDAKPGKNARRHYPCMKLDDICALPVSDIAAKPALLLMWTTVPFAEKAFEVIDAWGFRYVSQVAWVKPRQAMGFWARGRHELLYIAKRGAFPCPRPALFPSSVISAPTREHSRKPDDVHRIVDARLPDTRRLELFAREPRPGWTVWGNQTDKFEVPA